ncbi:hypothetical protein VKT23_000518 [Stygiomarasmius scandens]|uniref:dTMP kinase n=1 Tax=Marasmiellus scandens TaxID=2682957 RepID=A0ABR1K4J9_9AGAR
MPRGAFIVIEGLERSGKTTQTTTLCEQIEKAGQPVKLLQFPDRTTAIGKMIDAHLRSQSELDGRAFHLLFSANLWELVQVIVSFTATLIYSRLSFIIHLSSQIEKSLQEGTTVVCDRYAFSGIAFSVSTGLSYEWCRAPNISLPSPDLVLFLDISPEKAKERGVYREEKHEEEMQKRVRQVFKRIEDEMSVASEGVKWVVVDAGRDQETVSKDIWSNVESFLGRPIGRLWDNFDIELRRSNMQQGEVATPAHQQNFPPNTGPGPGPPRSPFLRQMNGNGARPTNGANVPPGQVHPPPAMGSPRLGPPPHGQPPNMQPGMPPPVQWPNYYYMHDPNYMYQWGYMPPPQHMQPHPPPPGTPHSAIPHSPRNPPPQLQGTPSTPTPVHAQPVPHTPHPHPPPPLSHSSSASISTVSSPPPTPSSASMPSSARMNSNASPFVPNRSSKITFKNPLDGSEVNLDALRSKQSHHPSPSVTSPPPSGLGSASPRRTPIKIESPEDKKKREEKEKEDARAKAEKERLEKEAVVKKKEAEEKAKKGAEEKMTMSHGGSRRGADRSENQQVNADCWAVTGGSTPRAPLKAGDLSNFGKISKGGPMTFSVFAGGNTPRAPSKAGGLSNFGKISKGGPMAFGPSSVFAGGKKDNKRESISRTNSSANMFQMLVEGGTEPPASTTKGSRPPSRKASVDLGSPGVLEVAPQRRRIVLAPRTKPLEQDATISRPNSDSESDEEVTDEPEQEMSEADAKKKIGEDTKEFFGVRSLDEAEVYFSKLPSVHHHRLVDKLVSLAIESKESNAKLVAEFFERAVSKKLCSSTALEEGFLGIAEVLDDIAIDAPKAPNLLAIMMKGASFDEEQRTRIASKSEENGSKLLNLLS